VKSWIQIGLCVMFIGLLGADIGLHTARWLGSPASPPRRAPQQASQLEGSKQNADAPDHDYTTLIIGVMTLLVLGYQTRIFYRQANIADKQTGISEKQLALVTQQTDLTERQFLLTGLQADILEKQKEIQRSQFFAAHRPKIVVKEVFFATDDNARALIYELANIGGSVGKITGGFVAVDELPDPDPRRFKTASGGALGELIGAEIKEGQVRHFSLTVPSNVGFSIMFPQSRRIRDADNPEPRGEIYFFGMLSYVDARGEEFGTVRASVFRRQWNFENGIFRRTGNPDHEYAD
jgi:hypothetical protein